MPLTVLLDTGVDPSSIDLAPAESLHLPIDRKTSGEAAGTGGDKHAQVFPATIAGLAIGGRNFAPTATLAGDLSGLSTAYGRRLDGVLGYSFLHDKIALIDYPAHRFALLDRPEDAGPLTRSCRIRWSTPMRFLADENWPLLPGLRFGAASASATLDTGSSGSVTLYRNALALLGLRAALTRGGQTSSAGFRGSSSLAKFTIAVPVGFGSFSLPPGSAVIFRDESGPAKEIVANVGNRLFAAIKLKVVLDYRARVLTFFGSCE